MSTASSLVPPPAPFATVPRAVRVAIGESIVIPAEVVDLDSFCRWAISDQYPQRGRFSYLGGVIWAELHMVGWRSCSLEDPMSTASSLVPPPAPFAAAPRAIRVVIDERVSIPADVVDLDSFCRWAISDQFPQQGKFSFLNGTIWVDLSMEELYRHNGVKTQFTIRLGALAESLGQGIWISDGMLLRNSAANLSTEPDGMFVSYDALRGDRVQRIEGENAGCVQLHGSPEMVLEVVSESNARKDTVDLRKLYWRAGIAEYWLVDARSASPRFDILRHGAKGYTATRKQAGGWVKSNVFARSFQLRQTTNPLGDPLYVLNVRT